MFSLRFFAHIISIGWSAFVSSTSPTTTYVFSENFTWFSFSSGVRFLRTFASNCHTFDARVVAGRWETGNKKQKKAKSCSRRKMDRVHALVRWTIGEYK